MDIDTVIHTLKALLAARLAADRTADAIGDDELLMEGGLNLDSIGIIELIGLVESEFDVSFQDEDLRTTTFESVKALANVISTHLNA